MCDGSLTTMLTPQQLKLQRNTVLFRPASVKQKIIKIQHILLHFILFCAFKGCGLQIPVMCPKLQRQWHASFLVPSFGGQHILTQRMDGSSIFTVVISSGKTNCSTAQGVSYSFDLTFEVKSISVATAPLDI